MLDSGVRFCLLCILPLMVNLHPGQVSNDCFVEVLETPEEVIPWYKLVVDVLGFYPALSLTPVIVKWSKTISSQVPLGRLAWPIFTAHFHDWLIFTTHFHDWSIFPTHFHYRSIGTTHFSNPFSWPIFTTGPIFTVGQFSRDDQFSRPVDFHHRFSWPAKVSAWSVCGQ